MLKQYGIVGTKQKGKGPWVQGNNIDYVFFSPNLKPLTHKELKEVVAEPTAESQNSIRWRYTVDGAGAKNTIPLVATRAMKKILELYPPKDKVAIRIPWQLNVNTAVHFASYEDRRIILVPSDKNTISPKLLAALGDLGVLRKHVHNYVFLKVPTDAPPELSRAVKQAGPDGLVIVERPEGRTTTPWQSMKVVAAMPGLHTASNLQAFLDKHVRPPGWDAKVPAVE